MLPMELRLIAIACLGVCVGAILNLAIYRLSWIPRSFSPWSAPLPQASPRRWSDRLPVVGWFGLRREANLHGSLFWLRPIFVEIATGFLLPALYWWEVLGRNLQPLPFPAAAPATWVHAQFVAHATLLCLMIVASAIDLDEKIIPDEITVPGTLLGLIAAFTFPWFLLPVPAPNGGIEFLTIVTPNPWPLWLDGRPSLGSLALAIAAWWTWILGLLPRPWRSARGWKVAVHLLIVRMFRSPGSIVILGIGLLGSLGITAAWAWGDVRWQGLLTSLLGMLIGGGIIWAVRNIGSLVLNREAMGFGDVTLMAMIGAFLGWQPCLIVFFVAPFFALVFGIVQLVVHRDAEIPYGPFLCMAAMLVVLGWRGVWENLERVFALGWVLGAVMFGLLGVLAILLALIQVVRGLFTAVRGG